MPDNQKCVTLGKMLLKGSKILYYSFLNAISK